MKETCPNSKLQCVTSIGAGDSDRDLNLLTWIVFKLVLTKVISDKNIQEAMITEESSWLKWLIVRPSRLIDAPVTGKYVVGPHLTATQIGRADVAHFLVSNIGHEELNHKTYSITYPN